MSAYFTVSLKVYIPSSQLQFVSFLGVALISALHNIISDDSKARGVVDNLMKVVYQHLSLEQMDKIMQKR